MEQNNIVVTQEREQERTIELVELAPAGLGFGEGAISTKKQLNHPELSGLTPAAMQVGAEVIKKSGVVFTNVDTDANDDGCGDGRPAAVIYKLDRVNGQRQEFKKSRRRPKIFGGGLIVASSMYRAVIAGNIQESATVYDDRVVTADLLDKNGIHYGGHTDDHAHDGNCGCGAIDKYPQITGNALKYRQEITAAMKALYGNAGFGRVRQAIDDVFASYEDQVKHALSYFRDAEGIKTQELMEHHGSVIKQLCDDHMENFLVINDIEGTTFDQRAFDSEMVRRGIEGTAQVFAIDAWRGRMYADFIANIAEQKGSNRQSAYQKAEADFWIRTLAVSATLTQGDLPGFMRRYQL